MRFLSFYVLITVHSNELTAQHAVVHHSLSPSSFFGQPRLRALDTQMCWERFSSSPKAPCIISLKLSIPCFCDRSRVNSFQLILLHEWILFVHSKLPDNSSYIILIFKIICNKIYDILVKVVLLKLVSVLLLEK